MRRLEVQARGFSLLEVMFAMAVLMVALVGALAGLIASAQQFKTGQTRQSKMVLLEAKAQRMMMAGSNWVPYKGGTTAQSGTWPTPGVSPTTVPESVAIGTSPWFVDPTPPVCPATGCTTVAPADLATGAYFTVNPQGTIVHDLSITPGTACSDPAIQSSGDYCREVFVATGLEDDSGSASPNVALPPKAKPVTVWVRVSKGGEDPKYAVVQRDTVMQ